MRHLNPPAVAVCATALLFATAYSATPQPFSTFLQENANVRALAHDAAGNIFAAGYVSDSPIPGHGQDIFVARLDAAATRIAYFVYLGGSGFDYASALAIDADGNAYVAGYTTSTDFPSPSQTLPPGSAGKSFPFLAKIDPAGRLISSALVENQASAGLSAIALDAAGNIIVTGYSQDSGFPSTGGGFSTGDSKNRPFVAKLDPSGSKILFSAIGVGGGPVAIGPQGDLFLSGNADGSGNPKYPITAGAFQTTFTPSFDCSFPCQIVFPSAEQYVTRLSADGKKLIYSTFITGNHGALNQGLAVDSAGNAYVTGSTQSTDYPFVAAPASGSRPGLFLSKLDPTGATLVWSVQQGGNLLALDAGGNLIAGGSFEPPGGLLYQPGRYPPFPPTGDTPSACLPDGYMVQDNAYVQRLSAADGSPMATQTLTATRALAWAIDVAPDGRVMLGGSSALPDVPITPGVVVSSVVKQRTVPGAFLAAFDLTTASIGGRLACVIDGMTSMPVGPVTPGQLITLYGTGLGPAQGIAASISGPGPAATSLGGVTVSFDGVPAPLAYVGANQINASVPFEAAGNPSIANSVTVMKIIVNGAVVASRQFAVAPSSPGLFIDPGNFNQGCGNVGGGAYAAVALNADGTRNSCANPAKSGSMVTVFLNGLNAYPVNGPPATGSITGPNPISLGPSVNVRAGVRSLETGVLTAWPGMIAGLYQLPVKMPVYLSTSPVQPLVLIISIADVPAAPFGYYDRLYQIGGLVWTVP